MFRENQEPRSNVKRPPWSERAGSVSSWLPRICCAIGFAALSIMLVVLYASSTQQAWLLGPVGGGLAGLLLAAVLVTLFQEGRTLAQVEPRGLLSKAAVLDFLGVVGGALVTYVVSTDLQLGAVTASGLIGLLGALVFPQQAVPIYCGSFVGMSSPALLSNHLEMLLAGTVAGIVYDFAEGTLNGFGGKLGTIAFTGAVVTGLGLGREFIPAEVPGPPLAWQIILSATVAAILTHWLSVDLEHGAVLGSSVVGLLGGLLLPALDPEVGSLLAIVVICGSFTGMSAPSRVPGHFWMTIAGLVTGVIFVYSMPVLGGAGGKLGTIAFGASMVAWILWKLLGDRMPSRDPDARSKH